MKSQLSSAQLPRATVGQRSFFPCGHVAQAKSNFDIFTMLQFLKQGKNCVLFMKKLLYAKKVLTGKMLVMFTFFFFFLVAKRIIAHFHHSASLLGKCLVSERARLIWPFSSDSHCINLLLLIIEQ